MIYITGELPPTAAYPRRQYAYLNVGDDGRTGTAFLNHWHAHRRHNTAVYSSTYSIGEVEAVGFAGRCFMMDKIKGEDEHPRKPGDRLPPYRVYVQERTGEDGEVLTLLRCDCMAAGCNAPTCRHADLCRELLEQGAFEGDTLSQGEYHENHATTQSSHEAGRASTPAGQKRPESIDGSGTPRRESPNGHPLASRHDPHFGSIGSTHPQHPR